MQLSILENTNADAPRHPPLVIDFTSNQYVYDHHDIPSALLKWRIFVGQEVRVILPTFCRGDVWHVRTIRSPHGSWAAPSHATDVVAPAGGAVQDLASIAGISVPARGEFEYPGVSFTFIGQKAGEAVVGIYKHNVANLSGTASCNLHLTVAER